MAAAAAAADTIGSPPPLLTQAEADSQVYIHDILHRDHDKEYRMYAAFLLLQLVHNALAALRIDHHGGVHVELVTGAPFRGEGSMAIWLMIHKGHMRLLQLAHRRFPIAPGAGPVSSGGAGTWLGDPARACTSR